MIFKLVLLQRLHQHVIHPDDLAHKHLCLHPDPLRVLMCLLQCDKLLLDCGDLPLEPLKVPLHLLLLPLSHRDPVLEGALLPLELRDPQLESGQGRLELRFQRRVLLL